MSKKRNLKVSLRCQNCVYGLQTDIFIHTNLANLQPFCNSFNLTTLFLDDSLEFPIHCTRSLTFSYIKYVLSIWYTYLIQA